MWTDIFIRVHNIVCSFFYLSENLLQCPTLFITCPSYTSAMNSVQRNVVP